MDDFHAGGTFGPGIQDSRFVYFQSSRLTEAWSTHNNIGYKIVSMQNFIHEHNNVD